MHDMFQRGFDRLYSRLWWTDHASDRTFRKAGWQYMAFCVEIHSFGSAKPRIWRRLVEQPSDGPPADLDSP